MCVCLLLWALYAALWLWAAPVLSGAELEEALKQGRPLLLKLCACDG